jgi:putative transposase
LLTEDSGVPVGLTIDGANRHDCEMTKATIKSIPVKRPKPTKRKKQGMCLDKGYDSGEVRDLVKAFGYT